MLSDKKTFTAVKCNGTFHAFVLPYDPVCNDLKMDVGYGYDNDFSPSRLSSDRDWEMGMEVPLTMKERCDHKGHLVKLLPLIFNVSTPLSIYQSSLQFFATFPLIIICYYLTMVLHNLAANFASRHLKESSANSYRYFR